MSVYTVLIGVANIEAVYSVYDKIEVQRSEEGESGPYYAITATSATEATLLGLESSPFYLDGKTLKFKINEGAEQTILFESADPINIDDVVDYVNENGSDLLASEEDGLLRLTTLTTGTSASIEITGGTALSELGFEIGVQDTGEDIYISLSPSQDQYEYLVQSGNSECWYRTRYYNSVTFQYSGFSDPVKATVSSVLPTSSLIKCLIDLSSLDGSPMDGVVVAIYNRYVPYVEEGYLLTGKEIRLETDNLGHAETNLVKGSKITVAFSGTDIVRDIDVPTTGTEFNIVEAIVTADDMFQIHVEDIPAAIRRS
jgi:hypothetical protein